MPTTSQEKGAVTPQETDPDLPGECAGVSNRGVGWQWPAAGLGALNVALHARDLLKEVTIIYSTSTIVSVQLSSGQSLSRVQLFATPWTVARQASLSITNSQSLHKLMSIESVMPSNHLILYHPLLLLPQSFPASGSFPSESALIRWPTYWSFSICPSNEYSGLIYLKIDWFDLLAVPETLKSLL